MSLCLSLSLLSLDLSLSLSLSPPPQIRPDLAHPLGHLIESIEAAKYSTQLGNVSAIRRLSTTLSPEQTVLKEYILLLQGFSMQSHAKPLESYSRKTLLTRVFGLPHDPSQVQASPVGDLNPSFASTSASASRYDLEVSIDQIRIIGLNPVAVLKRDAPTLYLSLLVQHSLVVSSVPSASATDSSSARLTLALQYSPSTSSWILEDKSLHVHLFSLTDSYSHCLLSCELWYKSLLRRKKKHVGIAQCPLGGIDTNETKMNRPVDVAQASDDFKERLTKDGGAGIQFTISMRLKHK
jgi:hypothetical protein